MLRQPSGLFTYFWFRSKSYIKINRYTGVSYADISPAVFQWPVRAWGYLFLCPLQHHFTRQREHARIPLRDHNIPASVRVSALQHQPISSGQLAAPAPEHCSTQGDRFYINCIFKNDSLNVKCGITTFLFRPQQSLTRVPQYT